MEIIGISLQCFENNVRSDKEIIHCKGNKIVFHGSLKYVGLHSFTIFFIIIAIRYSSIYSRCI